MLEQAQQLFIRHPLRTPDGLQLASAQVAAQVLGILPISVTVEQRRLSAAASEGFPTDDSNAHDAEILSGQAIAACAS